MERLLKELMQERQKLEQLKAEVNEMEFDALQRRFRRVNSTSLIPRVTERHMKHAFFIARKLQLHNVLKYCDMHIRMVCQICFCLRHGCSLLDVVMMLSFPRKDIRHVGYMMFSFQYILV